MMLNGEKCSGEPEQKVRGAVNRGKGYDYRL